MKLLMLCVLLCHLSFIACSFDRAIALSQSKLIPQNVYQCENSNAILWADAELKIEDGKKLFDFSTSLDEIIDKSFTLKYKVDKWVNGAWQENFYNANGPWCDLIMRYGRKAWEKLRNEFDPQIKEACNIEPASYTLKNFEVSTDDFDVPSTIFGTFRLTLKLLNKDGEEYLCIMTEVQSDRQ